MTADRPTLLECWCGRRTLEPSLRAALLLAVAHEHDEPRKLHANPPRPSRRPRRPSSRVRPRVALSWEQWQAVYAARAAAARVIPETYVSPRLVAAR